MSQFTFKNNQLKLSVRKSPLIIRIVLFLFAFAFFIFPVLGTIASIVSGGGLQFGLLIGIGIFALLGFYLLRIALWNTYGKETILFLESEIIYEADYHWFKDAKKVIENKNINYLFSPTGYEEDNEAVLILDNGKDAIECAVKMPQQQIDELIILCENRTIVAN
jgi:hypothetical protein